MKKHFGFIGLVIGLLLLAGCTRTEEEPKPETPTETVGVFETSGEMTVDGLVYLDRYEPWEHCMETVQAEDLIDIGSGVCRNYFWYLGAVRTPEGLYPSGDQGVYVLDLYDVKEKQHLTRSLTPADIGATGDIGYLTGMDMLGDGSYMFRWSRYSCEDEMYTLTEDQIIFTDLAGNSTKTDVTESFRQEGLETYEEGSLPWWPFSTCHATAGGAVWAMGYDRTGRSRCCLFSKEGECVFSYEALNQERLLNLVECGDGKLILPVLDKEGGVYHFYRINTQKGELELLGTLEQSKLMIEKIYGMDGSRMFCQAVNPDTYTGSGVVMWDITSGEKSWLLDYSISNLQQYDTLLSFSENKIVSVWLSRKEDGQRKDWIVSVSDEVHAEEADIRVADLTFGGNQVQQCAAYSTMQSPDLTYVYESAGSDEQRERILLELAQGGGPQLLFVRTEDFYNLSSKGILADMDALIPEDVRELLLPGALEMCRVDGKLLGIPAGVRFETLAVGAGVGDTEDWTLEHVFALMEDGKLNVRIRSPYLMQEDYLSPDYGMSILLNYSCGDSFLVDPDRKTSHFDDERFISYLELVKSNSGVVSQDPGKDLIWGYCDGYMDIVDLISTASGEGGALAGFPGQPEHEGYLVPSGGVLVVNANAVNDEAVSRFIRNLVSKTIQYDSSNFCLSIRKFVADDFLYTMADDKKFYFGVLSADRMGENGAENPLDILADLLENSCPLLPRYGMINQIINEETGTMLRDGKSAEETAKTINSRVEIYLNE